MDADVPSTEDLPWEVRWSICIRSIFEEMGLAGLLVYHCENRPCLAPVCHSLHKRFQQTHNEGMTRGYKQALKFDLDMCFP